MARYHRIDATTHAIINTEEWSAQPPPQVGVIFVSAESCTGGIGDLYDPESGEVTPPDPPPSPAPQLTVVGGILARFGATSPVETRELAGVSAVSRIANGRYRCVFSDDLGTDQYCVMPSVMDSAVRTIRYTARTSAYCEVRVVDQAGAAADAAEVIVEVKRVFQS